MTTKLRVLVVESDAHCQPILVAGLGPHVVVASADAARALAQARAERPTVAVIRSPLRDGDDRAVVQALQRRGPMIPLLVVVPGDSKPTSMFSPDLATYTQESPVTLGRLIQRLALLVAAHHGMHPTVPRLHPHVLRAAEYLGRHYSRPLATEDVARESGLSPGHLAHVFRLETGSTVMSRLRTIRLEVAQRLLADTDDTLEVIAHAVGYYDASHMSRLFLHELGCGPGTYRHRERGIRSSIQSHRRPVQERRGVVH